MSTHIDVSGGERTLDPRPTTTSRRVLPLLMALLVLALVFCGVALWRSVRLAATGGGGPTPVAVAAAAVAVETLPLSLRTTGSLQAVQEVVLAPEVAGRVVAIRFEAGAVVAEGAPLVQLFDAIERADRDAAVARAGFARNQLERSRELSPTGAETLQRLQQREAELAEATAAIAQIDARLVQKTVRAPFDGRIGIRRVNLGQYVNAGEPIATLVALDRLYVNFTVPQQDLAKLRVGGDVEVVSDAWPDRRFRAVINAIEPRVGTDTRNVTAQATLSDSDGLLRPGLYVTVEIAQPPRPDTILVPTTAIQATASGDSVLVLREGRAVPVPVVTGRQVGPRIVVERGLSAGDVVVTSGQLRIRPGAPVTVATGDDPPPAAAPAPAGDPAGRRGRS
ncbi:efflux RND transporter periplasmic adaptor subunit [Rhodoplanes sp. TEM]|uniref:Efflux RND transporter periplasmic adaptor subunit n=1 Tax=Rhodoplanes tepidamans TaxID=200616 RepID=A0ABT5JED8_RHOTP|nr:MULTISPECIES: efflux RND transporter periplasmic adaptor subunit [Rhodoplanes]MDC7787897.1 efflux RND transporter periplasmic adaptor subunit [Rhodoplanes tepidamans]MDC7986444.1 efflux RND transporter periplasmic adaptor subunit [Rhodoplanes sp. TEM]MDQ0353740.1 multidrug efflux system membrane fusion protein [Rhodoplanes tepidamans]